MSSKFNNLKGLSRFHVCGRDSIDDMDYLEVALTQSGSHVLSLPVQLPAFRTSSTIGNNGHWRNYEWEQTAEGEPMKLWDISTGTLVRTFDVPFEIGEFRLLDDSMFYSRDDTSKICVFSMETSQLIASIDTGGRVGCIDTIDDSRIITTDDKGFFIWNPLSNNPENILESRTVLPGVRMTDIAALNSSHVAIFAGVYDIPTGYTDKVLIFNITRENQGHTYLEHTFEEPLGRIISVKDDVLATVHRRQIKLWSQYGGTYLYSFVIPLRTNDKRWGCQVLSFADGVLLLILTSWGDAHIWDVQNRNYVRHFQNGPKDTMKAIITNDETLVATNHEGVVTTWRLGNYGRIKWACELRSLINLGRAYAPSEGSRKRARLEERLNQQEKNEQRVIHGLFCDMPEDIFRQVVSFL